MAEKSEEGRWMKRVAPGLMALLGYERKNLPHDLIAGLSVAAVAVPVAVAYAQLAGFSPVVGLYSSILPLVAYAIFGTSRQLIVGPDSGTCAIVAAALAPLAAGNADVYLSLSVALAALTGILLVGGSFLRLGALADFLSKPILVGFLNGIALSIILGQIGKIFGFSITSRGIIPTLIEFVSKLGETQWPTLAVGAGSFVVIVLATRFLPKLPAPLVTMLVAGIAVKLMGLEGIGVKTVGTVPGGFPHLQLPKFPLDMLPELFAEAAGVALVSFASLMPPARMFAAKNGYEVDIDKEMAALGVANLASAASQGFAISAADSRTAVGDAAGSKTQVTGLVAGAAILVVLLFFTGPLKYIPVAALGAVLVKAATSLVDVKTLRGLWRIDKTEFGLALVATLGVVAVGPVKAILVVVALSVLRFVKLVSRPKVEILGTVEGMPGFHGVARHETSSREEGIVLFRFNAPIVFFNAPYFKREALDAVAEAGSGVKWFVMDMIPVTIVDATGLFAVMDVVQELEQKGVQFVAAGRRTEWQKWAERREMKMADWKVRVYPTMRAAVKDLRGKKAEERDPSLRSG